MAMNTKGKKSKDDVDLIAAAAAKLALQQLDPVAKKLRQEFSCGLPQGSMSIHLKQLVQLARDRLFTHFYTNRQEILLYIRITVQEYSKCSKVFRVSKRRKKKKDPLLSTSTTDENFQDITIDQIKTFTLEFARNRRDRKNMVEISLWVNNTGMETETASPAADLILGTARLHFYDLLNKGFDSKVEPIFIDKERQHSVGALSFDYILRYGCLGYGYSHQLELPESIAALLVKESLLLRYQAPPNRRDGEGFLTPCALKKPKFIPFFDKGREERAEKVKKDNTSPIENYKASGRNIEAVIRLMRARKRLSRLRSDYSALTTRHDRISYLTLLVSNPMTELGEEHCVFDAEESDHDDDSSFSGFGNFGLPQRDQVKHAVGNLSPLLTMAESVILRARDDIVRERKTDLQSTSPEKLSPKLAESRSVNDSLAETVVSFDGSLPANEPSPSRSHTVNPLKWMKLLMFKKKKVKPEDANAQDEIEDEGSTFDQSISSSNLDPSTSPQMNLQVPKYRIGRHLSTQTIPDKRTSFDPNKQKK